MSQHPIPGDPVVVSVVDEPVVGVRAECEMCGYLGKVHPAEASGAITAAYVAARQHALGTKHRGRLRRRALARAAA